MQEEMHLVYDQLYSMHLNEVEYHESPNSRFYEVEKNQIFFLYVFQYQMIPYSLLVEMNKKYDLHPNPIPTMTNGAPSQIKTFPN